MKGIRRFFANAALLTLSALIMRSISVSFGAYVSKTAGAEAMGLFTLIMSVFGFALTLATSGVNLAVTRMVSEALGQNDEALAKKSMQKCLFYCLFFSFLSGILLFTLARPIGFIILKEPRTVLSLKILAVSLPFISFTSAFTGYFSAVRRVYKNTVYQISEQFIKIYFTVKLFEIFIGKGIEYACIALVVADVISEFSAFIISGVMYHFDRKKHIKPKTLMPDGNNISKKLLSIALPVALSTYIRSGLLTVEHILIPRNLIKSGYSNSEALSLYGLVHSMAMPIILFPTAILSSFAGLLIPELAEASVKNKKALVESIATRAFKYSFIFSLAISGLLICFSDELGRMIYNSSEVGEYIRLIAPLVPVMYLDSVTDAMLKGLGEQVYSMNVNIIDASLSIILVMTLLPRFGIMGYISTIYITESINAFLSVSKLVKITEMRPDLHRLVFLPMISQIASVSIGKLMHNLIDLPFSPLLNLISSAAFIICVYVFFIRFTGAVNRRDVVWLKYAIGIKQFSEDRSSLRPDARKRVAPQPRELPRNIRKC